MNRKNVKRLTVQGGKHLIMIIISMFMMFPLLWGVVTSFKANQDAYDYPPKFFSEYTLENYRFVFEEMSLGKVVWTNFSLAVLAVVIGIGCAVFASYVLSRYSFRGKKIVSGFIVLPMLIPGLTNLIPLYTVFSKLGLLDNFWALVFLYIPSTLPLSVMVLQNYLVSIPFSLEEAAMIDGCNRVQLLTRIVFPIIRPGIVAVAMIGFVNVWNEFLTTMIFTSGGKLRTLSVTMYILSGKANVSYGQVCAVGFTSILPVLIIFMIFRKQFISSIIDGAIKG